MQEKFLNTAMDENVLEMQEVLAEIDSISEYKHVTDTGIHHESK